MNESRKLLREQLRALYNSQKIIIGQAINTDRDLTSPLKKTGLSDQKFLDSLRYFVQKGYLRGYTRQDDLETLALTAEGADWLVPDTKRSPAINLENMRRAILEILSRNKDVSSETTHSRKVNKFNLIGKDDFHKGELEYYLDVNFTEGERGLAGRIFEDLKRDGYIQPTYDDLVDPENWVVITESGKKFLKGGLKDSIDSALEEISPHLTELRRGMWHALERDSPDAGRQAAHSARELVSQVLKEGSFPNLETRKERAAYIMKKYRGGDASNSDLDVIDASCKLIEAEHNKMQKIAHARYSALRDEVRGSVEAAERVLRLLFNPSSEDKE